MNRRMTLIPWFMSLVILAAIFVAWARFLTWSVMQRDADVFLNGRRFHAALGILSWIMAASYIWGLKFVTQAMRFPNKELFSRVHLVGFSLILSLSVTELLLEVFKLVRHTVS